MAGDAPCGLSVGTAERQCTDSTVNIVVALTIITESCLEADVLDLVRSYDVAKVVTSQKLDESFTAEEVRRPS